jgi:DNA-binding FadR family transcriptional regulator
MLDADVLRWRIAAQPTQALLDQLGEVRWMVEPASAALAATRRTDADLTALDAALAGMDVTSREVADAVEADVSFHTALLEATHNVLIAGLENVIEQGLRQRDLLVQSSSAASDSVPTHRAVLDAVREQDAPAAEQAMRALLEHASIDFERLRHSSSVRRTRTNSASKRRSSR